MGSDRVVRSVALWIVTLLVFACSPCVAQVYSYQLFGLDRAGGNEVDCLNFAWVEGTGSERYRPWAGSSFGRDSTTFYSTTWAAGPWGGEASIEWERQPSQTGPGTYWGWFNAAYEYYYGGTDYNGWNQMQLSVQRPTISGLNGAWYFGSDFVPNNGYYDATRLTADPTYADPETDPYWIMTAHSDKVDLTCTHCTATDAYSAGDTYPCNYSASVKFKVSVGGQNGFLSDEHWLVIDTPHQLSLYSTNHNGATSGNKIGFISTITYRVYSKCSQVMTTVALNERFTGTEDDNEDDDDNWGGAPSEDHWDGFNDPKNNTFNDTVAFLCYGCTPAAEWPGPLQSPPKAMSTTAVRHHNQEFRVGSTTNGDGVEVQANKHRWYIDHGQHDDSVSPVN